jgi:2-dehydropantoate 2-reductase
LKILVVGAGGVGGYFGGRLAAAGIDVTFVARGETLAVLRRDGLTIRSPLGDAHIERVHAVEHPDEAGPVDLVIVAVKLWKTEAVAATLAGVAARGAAVVSFQNGVEKDELLRRHVPASAVLGGVSYIAASIAERGVIAHGGPMQRLVFGEHDGTRSERVETFLSACQRAGIDGQASDAIDRLIWEKFVFLVGLSGTTSLFGEAIGAIRTDPDRRALLLAAMREVVAVGRAQHVALAPDFADDRLVFCDGLPATMTSSMAHDLAAGRRLELPWLSGAVVAMGKKLSIATPANERIVQTLAPRQDGEIG